MSAARFSNLADWLAWLEALHPTSIDLGLERVAKVARSLGLIGPSQYRQHPFSGAFSSPKTQVITIAGTNGKGSCVATLQHFLLAQGLTVGSYTSPHFHHFEERIQLNGVEAKASVICEAFVAIDQARGDTSLTYFEFTTLAALWLFAREPLDFILLEVGLGGRLDAVNIVDTDIAVITSIALDHEDWLGNDINQIAMEKAGVARPNKPLVCAETAPLKRLNELMKAHQQAYQLGDDFNIDPCSTNSHWRFSSKTAQCNYPLPTPSLPIGSVAAALQVLALLNFLGDETETARLVSQLELQGRYQIVEYQQRTLIFDVAHNPAAACTLAERLGQLAISGRTLGVMAVMGDKDIEGILAPLKRVLDHWYIGGLNHLPRAAKPQQVVGYLDGECADCDESIIESFKRAMAASVEGDRIVIFGSFFTVADIQAFLQTHVSVS